MKKKLLFVLVVLAIIISAIGCSNTEESDSESLSERKVLQVATPGQHYPWNYYESGELVGIDIATLEEACRRIGYDVEYKIMMVELIYGSIDAGKTDTGA